MAESWKIGSAEELRALAGRLAATFPAGQVVALTGDLGAGKTEFTKGIAEGLDYQGEVTSPTFALLQEYLGGRWPLFHLDFYRLEGEEEVLEMGWDDLLERGGVVVVEWPDRFPNLLPTGAVWIEIALLPDEGREVTQAAWGTRPRT